MNPEPEVDPSGTGQWRGLAQRAMQLVATRLELLGFELAEERKAATELIVLLAAGAVFAALAVVFVTLAIVLALPAPWRPWGALVAGLLYAGGMAGAFLKVRRILRERPMPFSATVAELKRDREWLETLK